MSYDLRTPLLIMSKNWNFGTCPKYWDIYISMFPSKGGSSQNITKWMDRWNVVYTYPRILFNLKKEINSKTCYNIDETGVHHNKWNKTQNDECCMIPLIQAVSSSQTKRE